MLLATVKRLASGIRNRGSVPATTFYDCRAHRSNDSKDSVFRRRVPELKLLTKPDCQLCEEAKEKLRTERPDVQLQLVEVDISADGHEDLYDLYRYEIPVFFLEGRFISKNRLDLPKLDAALAALTAAPKADSRDSENTPEDNHP